MTDIKQSYNIIKYMLVSGTEDCPDRTKLEDVSSVDLSKWLHYSNDTVHSTHTNCTSDTRYNCNK